MKAARAVSLPSPHRKYFGGFLPSSLPSASSLTGRRSPSSLSAKPCASPQRNSTAMKLPQVVDAVARRLPVIKALRLGQGTAAPEFSSFRSASAFLLDSAASGQYGGSGTTGNWHLARTAAQSQRIILAGGLTPENVAEAIRIVRPYAVDVASGVEARPGKKDPIKLRTFFEEVFPPPAKSLNLLQRRASPQPAVIPSGVFAARDPLFLFLPRCPTLSASFAKGGSRIPPHASHKPLAIPHGVREVRNPSALRCPV